MIYIFFAIIFLALLLLVKNRKFFNNTDQYLSTRQKIIFIVVILLSIPPIIYSIYVTYIALSPVNIKKWIDKTTKQVGFHIYRPLNLPLDKELSFILVKKQTEEGVSNLVTMGISNSPKVTLKGEGEKSYAVYIYQELVASDFNLENFINQQTNGKATIEQINLDNNKGYFATTVSDTSKLNVKSIYFVTSDSVFIQVTTLKASYEDLLLIANNLSNN